MLYVISWEDQFYTGLNVRATPECYVSRQMNYGMSKLALGFTQAFLTQFFNTLFLNTHSVTGTRSWEYRNYLKVGKTWSENSHILEDSKY